MVQANSAAAAFMTYSEWEAQSTEYRYAYIAGAFDALVSLASSGEDLQISSHYTKCVANSKMNNAQLSKNVSAYASTRPKFQNGPVMLAMINYLIELCGQWKPTQ